MCVTYRLAVLQNRQRKPATRTKLTDAEKAEKSQNALINRMGVDPEHDWKAKYEVLPGKEHVVAELKNWHRKSMKSIWQRIWTGKERRLPGI